MPGSARLRFAVRTLLQRPGFSLIVVGMLALGIAGTTAVFSVFDGLFLRPLPYPEPDRLVDLDETAPQWDLEFVSVSYPDFYDWRAQNETFEAMAVFDSEAFNMARGDRVERVSAAKVSHDMAAVLRIEPLLGRHISADEDRPGGERVVLLGEAIWRNELGGDPDVLGETLRLDGEPYTVIGVLPEPASYLADGDLWVPLGESKEEDFRGWHLSGIGRLKEGVTLEEAHADLQRVHTLMAEERDVNEITSPVVMPVLDRLIGEYRLGTSAMLGAVGVVLLIACANIAGLMLARTSSRAREIGIRIALGASRGRILLQLLTESLLLAAVGGVAGTVLGHLALAYVVSRLPDTLPGFVHFGVDSRFLAFTLAVVLGVALLFGLLPALRAARSDPRSAVHDVGSRTTRSRASRRGLNGLVTAEIALALMLLVSAGLFVRGFRALQEVDPGFRPESVLRYGVSLPPAKYDSAEAVRAFYSEHLTSVRAMVGVEAAGAGSAPPLTSHWGNFFKVEGAPEPQPGEQRPVVLQRIVTEGYFAALGIRLLAGRVFDDELDREGGERVVIVNEAFVRRFWPEHVPPLGEWPVGLRLNYAGGDDDSWMTVVGVTGDVKHYGLDTEMRPGLYLPHRQRVFPRMLVVARTSVDPTSLVPEIREAVRRADPEMPIFDVTTMSAALDESLWARRAATWLTAVFAATALLLAVGGIYGVVSYAVTQRTHELGIRMALGAGRAVILRQVLRQGLWLALVGLSLGLAGSVLAARALSSLLFGVSATDPTVYSTVAAILASAVLLAALGPARRAAGIEPMAVLRGE